MITVFLAGSIILYVVVDSQHVLRASVTPLCFTKEADMTVSFAHTSTSKQPHGSKGRDDCIRDRLHLVITESSPPQHLHSWYGPCLPFSFEVKACWPGHWDVA